MTQILIFIHFVVPIEDHLLPFGEDVGDELLDTELNATSPPQVIPMGQQIPFYEVNYDTLFVSNQ